MSLGNRAALRLVAAPFACGKGITLAVALFAALQHVNGRGLPAITELRGVAFAHWDSQSYLQIAAHGYPGNADTSLDAPAHVWAFLPGYPVLIAVAAAVLRDDIVAAVVVSAVLELVALVALARWVALERDRESARTAAWCLALFPYALFLSVVYTESAFLAAALVSILLMRQGRHVGACVAAALATSVRVPGLALLPALLIEYGIRHRRRPGRDLPAILLVPLPFVLFCLYAWAHSGDALAFFHIQSSNSFHRSLTSPITGLRATYNLATGDQTATFDAYLFSGELLFGVLGLIGCGALLLNNRVPRSLSVFAVLIWVLAVAQPYWLSVPRYELAMVPLLLLAADVATRRPELRTAMLTVFAAGLGYLTTLWAQGTFVA